MFFFRTGAALILVFLFPAITHALVLPDLRSSAITLLYGVIGFFGALALALFFGGFGMYMARLGTEHRVEGLVYMVRGVEVLFVVMCITAFLVWFA